MVMLTLAARNLRRNTRRTAITMVALVLGVASMVAMRGFINGWQRSILGNIVEGQCGVLQVHRTGYVANVLANPLALDMADTPELRAKLASVPGVTAVSPRIQFGAMISTPDLAPAPEDGSSLPPELRGKASVFMATAVDPTHEPLVTPRRMTAFGPGQLFATADAAEVVLNADFAKGMRVAVHPAGTPLPPIEQRVALLAADRDAALNGENVVVGGLVATFAAGDKRIGLVPLVTAQHLLRMEGRVTEYALRSESFDGAPALKADVQRVLGPGYEVHTWQELFPFIVELMGTQDFIFSIVTSIFLVVVLLGIVNAMLMSVLERTREIGTMLALGMERRAVVTLFLTEGLVLGIVGSVVGSVVGVLIVAALHRRGIMLPAPGASVDSVIRPTVDGLFMLRTVAQASLGSVLAALWPAFRASALRPVEALTAQ